MSSIIIVLNPAKLENPDADLRYDIPDTIEEITEGDIQGDGYDYDFPNNDDMAIFLTGNGNVAN